MRRILTLCLGTLFSAVLLAQAPGGVSSGLVVWLKADAGTSGTNDGDFLSYWNDQSAMANHATQASGSAQPKFKKFAFNGNPAIETTGGPRFFQLDLTDISSSEFTVVSVVKRMTPVTSNQYFLGVQQTSPAGLQLGYANNPTLRLAQNGTNTNASVPTFNAGTESPRIVFAEVSSSTGRKVSEVMDGVLNTGTNPTTTLFSFSNTGVIGRGNGTSGFTGFIAEVIVYNRVLTAAEQRQLQTYLSVKYGVTIAATDHLYFTDPTHAFDLVGIGRDLSGQGLNQASGTSENSDAILEVNNPSDLGDGEYLVMGHNNASTTFGAYAGVNCALTSIMPRTWKVAETGDVGTVTLSFDMTAMTFDAESTVLLIDQDNDGFNDENPIEGTYSAPYMTFTNISLAHNQRFTLAQGVAHWYSVASGNANGAIWAKKPGGTAQVVPSWCSRVDVTVSAGHTVTGNISMTAKMFEVKSGGTFTQGTNNLTVHGTFLVDGTFNAGNGTVYLNGTSNQSITGTAVVDFNNLTCNNPSGVTVAGGGARMRKVLQVNNGVFSTNGKLTLLSDATAQGSIGPLTTGDLTGNVTIQRYHNALTGGWVNLCTPIQNKTFNDWNDDLVTTGFPGSDYPSYPFNNIQWYNESAPGNKNQGYVGITHINDAIDPTKGYFVYMNAGAMNLDVDGSIFKGLQNLTVSYTNNGNASADGWSLVANPYPSAVDWNAAGWTKTNLNDAIYVWDASIAQYTSYIAGVGNNGGTNIIPSTQSFFVMANAPAAALSMTETVKSSAQGSFKMAEEGDILSLRITNGQWSDETTIVIADAAHDGFDASADAYKLRSPVEEVPYMATFGTDGADYSINAISLPEEEIVIPLAIEAGTTGAYELSWNDLFAFASGYRVVLEDTWTNGQYDLRQLASVKLSLEGGTSGNPRFNLRITRLEENALGSELPVTGQLLEEGVRLTFGFGQPTSVQVRAWNVLGQQLTLPLTDLYTTESLVIPGTANVPNCIVEVTHTVTGERTILRLGR